MTTNRWQQVEQIFHEACDLPAERRPAFLEHACQGDEALRREVESLLDAEPPQPDFLEPPALESAATMLASALPTMKPPEIPGYQIIRELGEGGMGLVYLAEQETPLRRLVALKLIKPGMDSRQVIARFNAERQSLALMDHPNIAAVYDAGSTPDGRPFFVMEFVDGVSIVEYCDRHRLPTRARLDLFTRVCAAAQHAHQKGVIHRDLKPSNVLVVDLDGQPVPKVIDFGTAKATEALLVNQATLTEQGTMLGTIEYMSPEQAAFSRDIDTTTDVYSLGVMLYELLVGALPFERPRPDAEGLDELRRLIRESDPPRPSTRLTGNHEDVAAARQTDADGLTRTIRGDLDWIVLKALEKDRTRRYPTVAAFAADIGRYLSDEPVEARPPSATYRVRKFTRRHRGTVAAAIVVLMVLLAGLTATTVQFVRAERARAEAQYREYVATVAATDGELRASQAVAARQRLLQVPVQFRGWEWQQLFLRSDASVASVVATAGCAKPGGLAPYVPSDSALVQVDDGARIYLKRCDATIESWDGTGHQTVKTPGPILGLGSKGDALVRITHLGTPREPDTWEVVRLAPGSDRAADRFGPFDYYPQCAALSPDGARIAVGILARTSRIAEPLADRFELWDVRTGRQIARMLPAKPPLFDTRRLPAGCLIAFSADATKVATSGATVHVWRANSGAELAADSTQAGSVSQPIAFSPDGRRLAIGRLTGLIDVLRVDGAGGVDALERFDGGVYVPRLELPDADRRMLISRRSKNEVLSLAWAPGGEFIVSGAAQRVGLWNVSQRQLTTVSIGHAAEVVGVAVTSTGWILSADTSGAVKVWPSVGDVAKRVSRTSFAMPDRRLSASADGRSAAAIQFDGGVILWRLADSRPIVLRAASGQLDPQRTPDSVAISADGRRVLLGENDDAGTVSIIDVESHELTQVAMNLKREPGCEKEPQGVSDPVYAMAVSPDGRSLAFRQSNCLVVRDLASVRTLAVLPEHPSDFAFRADGSLLVASYPQKGSVLFEDRAKRPDDTRIRIWDWRAGRVRAEIPSPRRSTSSATVGWWVTQSADATRVALWAGVSGVAPAVVSIWDGELKTELGRVPVPDDTTGVALSADGHRAATMGRDTFVRIWDVDRGQQLLLLEDDDQHTALAFARDGRLIAGRASGGLTIWESQQSTCASCPPAIARNAAGRH